MMPDHSITIRRLDRKKLTRLAVLFSILSILTAIWGMVPYFAGTIENWIARTGYVPMAPSTAISIILLGSIVLTDTFGQRSRIKTNLGIAAATLVFLFTLLEIIGFFSGADLNFEKALSPDRGTLNRIEIGLMSPATALITCFIAGGLLLRPATRFTDSLIWKDVCGVVVVLALIISFVFTLAYLYGSPLLYDVSNTIPVAFSSAAGFLFLSTATMITNAQAFPIRLFERDQWKNYLLRYLMPLSVLLVVLGGFTTIIPIRFLGINPTLLNALLTLVVAGSSIFFSAAIAGNIERQVNAHQRKLKKTMDALEESEERYRILFETMVQGVVYQDSDGKIIEANPAAEKILGLSIAQMKGRTSIDPRWRAVDKDMKDLPGEYHPAMLALHTGKPVENFIQGIYNPKVEDYVWIIVNSVPQYRSGSDQPWQVFSTFLDITERYTAEKELLILKTNLERQVATKTGELRERIEELEHFQEVTIERELRMEELRKEIAALKKKNA